MDIATFLKHQKEKFQKGYSIVGARRSAWASFQQRASTRLNSICKEAPTQELFEFLYVQSASDAKIKANFLTFFFGQHPIGYDHTKGGNSLASEGGCALHYTQGPTGNVVCLIYPFSSDLMTPKQKHYLYTVYCSPERISDKDIYHHVQLMFSVAHYSSCFGSMGLRDWLNMFEIRLNGLWNAVIHRDPIDYVFSAFEYAAKKIVGASE